MPSSSSSSRCRVANGVSPGWLLPPGNSQEPAMCVPARRWFTSHRPCPSAIRPTSTWTRRGTVTSAETAVALLVFLAGTAGTGLVAPDLRLLANVGLHLLRVRRRHLLTGRRTEARRWRRRLGRGRDQR